MLSAAVAALVVFLNVVTGNCLPIRHVPITGGSAEPHSIASAIDLPTQDTDKSYAVYSSFTSMLPHWYHMKESKGDPIFFNIYKPIKPAAADPDRQSQFSIVLMDAQMQSDELTCVPPGSTECFNYTVIINVTTPSDGQHHFEAFGPSSLNDLWTTPANLTAPSTGSYYLALFPVGGDDENHHHDEHEEGEDDEQHEHEDMDWRYGLALGRAEEFSGRDLAALFVDVYSVHRWERQSHTQLLLPLLISFLAAVALLALPLYSVKRVFEGPHLLDWMLIIAGGSFFASGFNHAVQMIVGLINTEGHTDAYVVFTVVVVLIHWSIALGALVIALRDIPQNRGGGGGFPWWKRLTMLVIAVGSLFFFAAGVYLGNVVLVGACLMPHTLADRRLRMSSCEDDDALEAQWDRAEVAMETFEQSSPPAIASRNAEQF